MSLRYITRLGKYVFSSNEIKIPLLLFYFIFFFSKSGKKKEKETKEKRFFEAWRKNRRARVRVFHSRLRVTSGEREAFKLREWLFLSFTEHKRGRKTIKIVVNVVTADVRQGRSFRNLDFIPFEIVLYIHDSFTRFFRPSFRRARSEQFEQGGKMVNGSMVKIGGRGVATNGIFSGANILPSDTLFKRHRGGYFSLRERERAILECNKSGMR